REPCTNAGGGRPPQEAHRIPWAKARPADRNLGGTVGAGLCYRKYERRSETAGPAACRGARCRRTRSRSHSENARQLPEICCAFPITTFQVASVLGSTQAVWQDAPERSR